jgi:hypothetical protein
LFDHLGGQPIAQEIMRVAKEIVKVIEDFAQVGFNVAVLVGVDALLRVWQLYCAALRWTSRPPLWW